MEGHVLQRATSTSTVTSDVTDISDELAMQLHFSAALRALLSSQSELHSKRWSYILGLCFSWPGWSPTELDPKLDDVVILWSSEWNM